MPSEKDHKSNSFYFNFSVLFRAKEIHDGESIAIVPSFIVLFSLKKMRYLDDARQEIDKGYNNPQSSKGAIKQHVKQHFFIFVIRFY